MRFGQDIGQRLSTFSSRLAHPSIWLAGLSVLALSACDHAAKAQAGGGAPQPTPVPVVEVQPKDLAIQYDYPAQITGVREVEIRPRVSGIIEKRLFEEGGKVRKGQSLYKLDDAPYQTALLKAKADALAAKARLDKAQSDFSRIAPLLTSKAVSQAEFDNAKSTLEIAKADLAVAKAQVRQASLNVTYSRVLSPVTGYVGRSQKSEGSLVSGPQDLLTRVTQVDQVYANFGMPEADHELIQTGMAKGQVVMGKGGLKVEILDDEGHPNGMQAQLSFQDVRVNPSTGTIDARALFNNKSDRLSPGQFVKVRLSGAVEKNAVLLPQRAVLQSPMGGKIVMTVSPDNKVAPRPVEVAQWADGQWVITSGLKAGDKVITDGFIKTPPGTPVKPMIQEAKASDSTSDQTH